MTLLRWYWGHTDTHRLASSQKRHTAQCYQAISSLRQQKIQPQSNKDLKLEWGLEWRVHWALPGPLLHTSTSIHSMYSHVMETWVGHILWMLVNGGGRIWALDQHEREVEWTTGLQSSFRENRTRNTAMLATYPKDIGRGAGFIIACRSWPYSTCGTWVKGWVRYGTFMFFGTTKPSLIVCKNPTIPDLPTANYYSRIAGSSLSTNQSFLEARPATKRTGHLKTNLLFYHFLFWFFRFFLLQWFWRVGFSKCIKLFGFSCVQQFRCSNGCWASVS